MKWLWVGLAAAAIALGGREARALTSLMRVTPENIKETTFRVTSKSGKNKSVEFVIRRDISKIDGPGRAGYLSDADTPKGGLGTRLKLEEDPDKTLTFRFSVPLEKLGKSVFRLWGRGMDGEGVTFDFELARFWKEKK